MLWPSLSGENPALNDACSDVPAAMALTAPASDRHTTSSVAATLRALTLPMCMK